MMQRMMAGLAALALPTAAAGAACGPVSAVPLAPVASAATPPAACDEGALGWDAGDGIAVWRCTLRLPEGVSPDAIEPGALTDALMVARGGQVLHQQADYPSPWGAQGLKLLRTDLSGDGEPETVLAAHNTSGQGMGIEYWTLSVFARDWSLLGLRTEVADWGPDAFVPRRAGQPGCAVLLTDWREQEAPGGKTLRYFTGTRADVGGELPRFDTGPEGDFAARRYDRRFERERVRDIERMNGGPQRTPARWLAREIARAVAEDDAGR